MQSTIMVIEDDPDLLRALSDALSEAGYQVIVCDDGAAALARIHAGAQPALILLDLKLPHLDGWVFRRIQQELDSVQNVPVIVMTALPDAETHAKRLKAAAWFSKPIQMNELLETVHRCARAPLPVV